MSSLPPIDVADLRVLVSLATERHFARAAQACNMSQPALSTRIRRMEEALETPLVQRGQRFLGFTEAGERVLTRARRVLADLDGLRQDVTGGGALSGRLRIGVIPSATPLAGRLAATLAREHPGVDIVCTSLSSRMIEAGLLDYSIDAGITYLNNEPLHNVDTLALQLESYCLVGSRDLLGETATPSSWRQAADWPLALLTPDMQNRRILDKAFSDAGATPQVVFEANSFLSIFGRAGRATSPVVAILPRMIVDELKTDALGVRELEAMRVQPVIGLVAPRRNLQLPLTSALWRACLQAPQSIDNLT
ncbi:LysR family transcriptional regulator [Stappia sp. ES.058]|uniref:LysR family transcriptional regulator n=1 Tax=Stappia sp. ES.058 TaxID=1881061 RepID=UPI00087A12B8|nr:LysR substrate-binding domain-containing protein [Stappia sp. ES.058]SDT97728.1 transcriptional regulator, LysR family [Stappia sp. ES.058]